MVPTINSIDETKDDFRKATVGIKIGDGETVFKDLPLLTDVSSIRPDWDETDTSSPNYIWHKPITNSSLIVSSEIKDYVITDVDFQAILNNPSIKVFHSNEYYYIRSLDSSEIFSHPYDLLTEEDDTWGHYDVRYNLTEINHQPRYFYRNNIITNTEFYQYAEDDITYEYRVEELVESVTNSVIDTNVLFQEHLFIDYNDKQEVNNTVSVFSSKVSNYLTTHNGKIEHQTLYDFILETFTYCESLSILKQFSGVLYEKMIHSEFRNEVEIRMNEARQVYYEINNEIIIDTATRALYIRKERLDHYFETAHGKQEWSEVLEGSDNKPITSIQLPFEVTGEMLTNDWFSVEIVGQGAVEDVKYSGSGSMDSFEYPLNYTYSEDRVAEIEAMEKSAEDAYNNLPEEEKPSKKEEYDAAVRYLVDYKKNVKLQQIYATTMRVKEPNLEIPDDNVMNNEATYLLQLPKELLPYYIDKNTGSMIENPAYARVDVLITPKNYEWTNTYTGLSYKKPLETIDFVCDGERLSAREHLRNTIVTMQYADSEISKQLYLDRDFIVEKKTHTSDPDRLLLIRPIKKDCSIKIEIKYEQYKLEPYDYTLKVAYNENIPDEITSITFELNNPINKKIESVLYIGAGVEYTLQYMYRDRQGYYTVEEGGEKPIIKLWKAVLDSNGQPVLDDNKNIVLENDYINLPATITFTQGYNLTFKVGEDDIDPTTNTILLKTPIQSVVTVYYRKNSNIGGNLSMVFHYRLRELNSRFLSSLRPDWDSNDPEDNNYIHNRPWYKDTENGNLITLLKGDPNAPYTNGATDYYTFLKNLWSQLLEDADLGDNLAELSSAFKEHMHWVKNCTFNGLDAKGLENVLQALVDLVNDLRRRVTALEEKSEVYIGSTTPDKPYYKIWINTAAGNGNGLVYYRFNNGWIPVSALWTSSPEQDIVIR